MTKDREMLERTLERLEAYIEWGGLDKINGLREDLDRHLNPPARNLPAVEIFIEDNGVVTMRVLRPDDMKESAKHLLHRHMTRRGFENEWVVTFDRTLDGIRVISARPSKRAMSADVPVDPNGMAKWLMSLTPEERAALADAL